MIRNTKTDTIGGRLRWLRYQRGYSLEQVANELKVSSMTISKWERGKTSPKVENLEKLANFFQIPKSYFLTGEIINTSKLDGQDDFKELENILDQYLQSPGHEQVEASQKKIDDVIHRFSNDLSVKQKQMMINHILSLMGKNDILLILTGIVEYLSKQLTPPSEK